MKKSTFAAFIDFKKAYDCVNRNVLWKKLHDIGVNGKMFSALQSLYHNVRCCVRVNGLFTPWFDVNRGLKQGCLLSPILFNFFINDLLEVLNHTGTGINVDGTVISALAYADDIILLAESDEDLNKLLEVLHNWCDTNDIVINADKSHVVHFRNPSVTRTMASFSAGSTVLNIVSSYTYLGLLLTEHLDYTTMANVAAKSGSRALGLLISKCKAIGGAHFNTYCKLYDTMVWSVINYGASIWGSRDVSAVNAVHHRAIRFFLGVGKYTPNVAINGDTGWVPPIVRQWVSIIRQWCRFRNMPDRLNKLVFTWAEKHSCKRKNWNYCVMNKVKDLNMQDFFIRTTCLNTKAICCIVQNKLMNEYIIAWNKMLQNNNVRTGTSKLRTYRLFKDVYGCENYVSCNMPRSYRSALAKFRCGVAPLKIETGRYVNLDVNERVCFHCNNIIEDEEHVLLHCPLYDDLRQTLFLYVTDAIPNFLTMPILDKLCILFNHEVYITAKTCFLILQRRKYLIYG